MLAAATAIITSAEPPRPLISLALLVAAGEQEDAEPFSSEVLMFLTASREAFLRRTNSFWVLVASVVRPFCAEKRALLRIYFQLHPKAFSVAPLISRAPIDTMQSWPK